MRTLTLRILIAAIMMMAFATTCFANEAAVQYRGALAHYFEVSEDVVDAVYALGLSDEDVTVALYISARTGASATGIAGARAQGSAWIDIAKVRQMKPADFYVMVVGGPTTGDCAEALAQFKPTPHKTWTQVDLDDQDLVNLVNLRFVASENDWSVFDVISLRDGGEDFVSINYEVFNRKEAYLYEQDEVMLAR